MVESPEAGFTGTIWDAVPAEQLAHELTSGPGPGPMAEAGLAYTALAAGLGGAAAEFRAVLAVIGEAWGSHSNEDGLAQLARLADWLEDTSTAARDNAATAAQQAASYEIARVTMPHVTEVAQAAHTVEDMVRGSLLGAPLAGLLDTVELQLEALREQAAQVMRTYEAASATLAAPWQHDQAPEVSAGAALLAEQSAPPARDLSANTPVVQQPALQLPHAVDLVLPDIAPQPTVTVGGESLVVTPVPPFAVNIAQSVVAAPPVAVATPPAPPPILPAPVAEPEPRPPAARALGADAGDISGRIVVDTGFVTAPAVLGVTADSRPAAPVAAAGQD
ncbi:PPE domain-containing protein [Nocardia sp. NPDC005366]|uniref:PPE domain-containing protein n=1 Tax=Nocardia sp. NPDC005366 TaxID=3156878 RepID=UPI0033B39B4B